MSKQKITVGILFGGRSAEHQVSLQSAKSILNALDRDKYQAVMMGIDPSGRWQLYDSANFLIHASDAKLIKLNSNATPFTLTPQGSGEISLTQGAAPANILSSAIDVIFPVLHGPFGEDGSVQGLLKLANIPFVGASVLGSAIGMDKVIMKRLLRDAGIPSANFISLKVTAAPPKFSAVVDKLGLPIFIKPANLGSSVGISKVVDEAGYLSAIKLAFQYDNKLLIEENISGREMECAVLGNHQPKASVPGEVIPSQDFYSYQAKYIDELGASYQIPAKLPTKTGEKIQQLAIATFQTLDCAGLARVDFFLRDNGDIVVNEINTMPGFTAISMYPKLWQASGISYSALIDELISLAFERFADEQRLHSHLA